MNYTTLRKCALSFIDQCRATWLSQLKWGQRLHKFSWENLRSFYICKQVEGPLPPALSLCSIRCEEKRCNTCTYHSNYSLIKQGKNSLQTFFYVYACSTLHRKDKTFCLLPGLHTEGGTQGYLPPPPPPRLTFHPSGFLPLSNIITILCECGKKTRAPPIIPPLPRQKQCSCTCIVGRSPKPRRHSPASPLRDRLKQPSRSPASESAPHCRTTAVGRYISITFAMTGLKIIS